MWNIFEEYFVTFVVNQLQGDFVSDVGKVCEKRGINILIEHPFTKEFAGIVFARLWRNDAAAIPQTDIIDGEIQWKQYFNRLW